jgi:hypothetical protein
VHCAWAWPNNNPVQPGGACSSHAHVLQQPSCVHTGSTAAVALLAFAPKHFFLTKRNTMTSVVRTSIRDQTKQTSMFPDLVLSRGFARRSIDTAQRCACLSMASRWQSTSTGDRAISSVRAAPGSALGAPYASLNAGWVGGPCCGATLRGTGER